MTETTASRRSGTTRRTILRGAAWAAPTAIVTTTAPAFAASACINSGYTVDFTDSATYTKNSSSSATAQTLGQTGVDPVVVTIGAVTSNSQNLGADHLNSTGNGLTINNPAGFSGFTTTTFTFSRPVENLTFTVKDIDGNNNSWQDSVRVGGTRDVVRQGSNVLGVGRVGDPFIPRTQGNLEVSDPAGHVTLNFPGPTTSFAVYFTNADPANQWHNVWLSEFTFEASRGADCLPQ